MEIDDLHYYYKDKIVLDGVTLDIRKGEILGILGPNGCGKTTLLGNLNKNLSPKLGKVLLNGKDLEDISKKNIAKVISVVPQTNEVKFAFTVRDIVSMARMPFLDQFSGESDDDIKIVDDALEKTGLTDFADRLINTMSGGERQRVVIARAIAQTPDIILLDEPTLHLDINAQFDVLDLVYSYSKEQGKTVVVVSHDLQMMARYCDRIVLIHNHKIFAEGIPEHVLTPENMATVFKVDGELMKDPVSGRNTVLL
ncbi:MAG: ABC transporter ATP-binding protein, partial [Lentisphaerae bacterium]|nr:ABC transporter ATP-binding protein [Lentisphaerota bacterium]